MARGERALVPEAEFRSYYGRPVLKEPVWKWEVPAYFFLGGIAAGSAIAAAGADLLGRRTLARQGRVIATAGAAAGATLLVADLGRPERFHHMLRVAKPTSPMNVGSWTLAVFGPAAGLAALSDVLGVFPRAGRLAGLVAGALGPVLGLYTAVLVSDTAVPVWHEAGRELPFVFAGGAAASTGAMAVVLTPIAQAVPARRMLLLGVALELGAARAMERSLPGDLAEPYKEGRAARLVKAARALTATGAGAVALLGRRNRLAAAVGGGAVLAGALLTRLAVVEAGRVSARDPKYTVVPQRQRVEASRLPRATAGR